MCQSMLIPVYIFSTDLHMYIFIMSHPQVRTSEPAMNGMIMSQTSRLASYLLVSMLIHWIDANFEGEIFCRDLQDQFVVCKFLWIVLFCNTEGYSICWSSSCGFPNQKTSSNFPQFGHTPVTEITSYRCCEAEILVSMAPPPYRTRVPYVPEPGRAPLYPVSAEMCRFVLPLTRKLWDIELSGTTFTTITNSRQESNFWFGFETTVSTGTHKTSQKVTWSVTVRSAY